MFNSKALLASTLVALLPFVSAIPTESGTDAAAAVQPTPNIGTTFAVYPGWDMNNGEIARIMNETELQCLQACSANPSCLAYAYTPYTDASPVQPVCFIKNAIDLTTITLQSVDVSVGLIGACGTFNPVGPTNCFTVTVPT
ncbi:hypothetical protein B0H17DRAFT_1093576 [Mycena rosella]|uniref:Apple domain-containing protein n=1 Tax=Mycena rosella TaxID=1033263 RepID=A0AAD7CTK4_MYCRO|nr:hypothetical protein B0H17DRAFT_1093576 [Mycena rosella]